MPLSELFRLSTGKLESSQSKPCPSEISLRGENALVELVWENGQVKMQSQTSRAARSPVFEGSTNRVHGGGAGNATATRSGKFASILDDISPGGPSGELDLSQDDDMVPWLRNYPKGDALPQDYSSEFLSGMFDVTGNRMSTQNSFASVGNLQSGGSNLKASLSTAHGLGSWPSSQHRQTSDALGSGISDVISGNNLSSHSGAVFGNAAQGRDIVNDCPSMKVEMAKHTRLPTNTSNLVNFSYFSRPAALVNSKRPTSDGIPTSFSSGMERVELKEASLPTCVNNADKSRVINQSDNKPKDIALPALPVYKSRQLSVPAPGKPCCPETMENVCREIKNNEWLVASNAGEPMAASSSVCSGNGANRVSCEKTPNLKRKFCDVEDLECHSDDIETESTGVTKPMVTRGGSGSKRSRAAEVHNLSERRRRDRINEKMRALQELIPNCSKVDKASMLDEAIEYLKTLQLQVQIMSMGAGLGMPPMMFPMGMQHMRPAHIPHFSPMSVGMGMGMGYGMAVPSIPNMNGRAPGCPIFPIPPMQAGHFPSPMPGLHNLQRVPAPSVPVYGHLDQGLCSSVPRAPLTGQPPMKSTIGLSGVRNECQNEAPGASSKKNKNSDSMLSAEASSSLTHKSTQPQASNEAFDRSSAVQENDITTVAGEPTSLEKTTVKETGSG